MTLQPDHTEHVDTTADEPAGEVAVMTGADNATGRALSARSIFASAMPPLP